MQIPRASTRIAFTSAKLDSVLSSNVTFMLRSLYLMERDTQQTQKPGTKNFKG